MVKAAMHGAYIPEDGSLSASFISAKVVCFKYVLCCAPVSAGKLVSMDGNVGKRYMFKAAMHGAYIPEDGSLPASFISAKVVCLKYVLCCAPVFAGKLVSMDGKVGKGTCSKQ